MQNTHQFFHLPWKIHIKYELLRSRLVDLGFYSKLAETYIKQKYFLSDENSSIFWDRRFDESYENHLMAESRELIITNLLNSRKNILNIGVGRGNLERRLIKKFGTKLKYFGTDITPKTLEIVKKTFPKMRFYLSKPSSLPFEDSTLDQVLLLEVLEHIKPTETFTILNEICRVCRPGARFIISVPINEKLINMLPVNPNSHMRIYTEQLICYELRRAGFNVKRIIRLSAFSNYFLLKTLVNYVYPFRETNNLIIVCKKAF